MTKKKDDLDIDLDDISGDKKATEAVAKEAIEEAVEFINKKAPQVKDEVEDEWSACLARLKKSLDKTWICLPTVIEDKLYIQNIEMENCTGEQFLTWLHLVYPPSKELKDISADSCSELKYRKALFDQIRQSTNFMKFPKNTSKTDLF